MSQHSLSKIEDLYLKLFKVRVLSHDTEMSRLTTGEWKTAQGWIELLRRKCTNCFRFLFDLGLDDIGALCREDRHHNSLERR